MKRGLPELYSISALEWPRPARFQPDDVIDHRAVHGTEVFHFKDIAVAPNARVPARDLCVRIESRQIDLRKDIGKRIGPAQKVSVSLLIE